MSVVEVLERLGGVATRAQLLTLTSRSEVDRVLAAGDVVALARGRYALPTADAAVREAHRLHGVVCLESAALHWGWAVKRAPRRPQVMVPRSRRLTAAQRRPVELHRRSWSPDDVDGHVTTRERTLLDCLRAGPFDAALAVADSALRDGFPPGRLRALAHDARGPGSAQVRRVADQATPLAANPFESVLRAIALDVAGLRVRPQVPLYAPHFLGCPDLVDEDLRLVLEADSFEWHGGRKALCRDARRYNELVVHGWTVLRFSWEDVMDRQDDVRRVVEMAMAVAGRTDRPCGGCAAA